MNSAPPSKTALITGASTGIGYELCKLFAADGYNLVIVSRNGNSLKNVATDLERDYQISAYSIAKDLSVPEAAQEIYDEIQSKKILINALVNNAGFGTFGLFAKTELSPTLEMIEVNVTSLTRLTKLFLDDMIATGTGKILNIASTAAFQPGPLMAVYYASKAYVLSFSDALAYEIRGTGVTVTALCPGPTKTEFKNRAHMGNSGLFTSPNIMDAKRVAEIGYAAMIKGKRVVIAGFTNKLFAFTTRFSPRWFVLWFVYHYQKMKG